MIVDLLQTEKRSAIERWVRANTQTAALPNGDTLCRVLGEWPMVVTLEDLSVAPHLVLDGYWEMWVTMCLARRVKPGWHSIDIGANVGYYTLLLAALAGETGRVEAWEPQLGLAQRLVRTVALNGLEGRVTVRSWAAGSEGGVGRMELPAKHDRGGAHVVRAERGAVQIAPITNHELPHVDCVKIDTEGMEPEVWLGGIAVLRPRAVLIEWTPSKYADPPEFMARIRADGYTVGVINQHGDVDVLKTPEEHAALSGISGWQALWLERQG